jgi:periplasmic protein TonB
MTTTTKPHQGDRVKNEVPKRKFRRNPIVWFILASVLVHVLGSISLVWLKRSPLVKQKDAESAPIDFIVLPPENSAPDKKPDKTATSTPPQRETQPQPEPPDPPVKTDSSQVAVPESAPKTPPPTVTEPKPVTPPPVNNNSEILSGSDPAIEATESVKPPNKVTQPPDTTPTPAPSEVKPPNNVATRLPPKPVTPPTAPPTDSGAASLLGGDIKRSIEDDGGDSFFDIQAEPSQQAYNPALLNEQQNIDMRKYFSEIQRRVRENWNPQFAMEEYTTVLNFTIEKNGQITGLEVFQTSGNPDVDREALEAIQNSGPFAPLPASFPLNNVNIGFNFNIYIY